ncbi:MAG: glycoside hydrolase family 88 protein [Paenibacillaceae bacterium]|nr:glycoside hydrolase family 88 protein [Paenibacillaceae bacterium]
MWKRAIEDAVTKTRANLLRFGEQFPHVSEADGVYQLQDNSDWTEGFWGGILWLCYEYSGDRAFAEAAKKTVASFRQRMENNFQLNHHDIGFLYSLSSGAQWIIERDEAARRLTLQAAETLMRRWRPKGQYLQAWGREDDPDDGGRIIIDCLLNVPLLHWAFRQTGDSRYRDVAVSHTDKSRKYLIRGDDSSYHTFHFARDTGYPLRGNTFQGEHDGSVWSRGQAWGLYGFALAYVNTGNEAYLETSRRLANYFIANLPNDHVPYWDFAVAEEGAYRDSSAAAIAACGMLELLDRLSPGHPDRSAIETAACSMVQSLAERYSTIGDADAQGFIRHGAYHVKRGLSPDGFMIWGDYFYLEALMRLERRSRGYWYERPAT